MIFCLFVCFVLCFSRQDFSVVLEPVLELALVEQVDFELTEIRLPLKACATTTWLSLISCTPQDRLLRGGMTHSGLGPPV